MIPFNVVIIIIVSQCLINLLGIWALAKENNKKAAFIEKQSEKLRDQEALVRKFHLTWRTFAEYEGHKAN